MTVEWPFTSNLTYGVGSGVGAGAGGEGVASTGGGIDAEGEDGLAEGAVDADAKAVAGGADRWLDADCVLTPRLAGGDGFRAADPQPKMSTVAASSARRGLCMIVATS